MEKEQHNQALATGRLMSAGFLNRICGAVLLCAGFVLCFYHNFYEMWLRWFPAWRREELGLYNRFVEGESYYTHGPLIPLASIALAIYLIRRTRMTVRPSKWGLVLLIPSLVLHLFSTMARVNFTSCFAMIGVIAGLVILLWGFGVFRRLWFPICFLLFMVPLPEVTIARWNFNLKLLTADWGVWGANVLGLVADRAGSRVFLEGNKSLVIANVCNGLRTIISLLAFGAFFAYLCRLRGAWRWLLFSLTLPIALICNTIRIVALLFVAHWWNAKVAAGWFHDISGILIFIMALLLMMGAERMILWFQKRLKMFKPPQPLFFEIRLTDGESSVTGSLLCCTGRLTAWIAVGLLLTAGVLSVHFNQILPRHISQETLEALLPAQVELEGQLLDSYPEPLDAKTLTILENPSYFSRRYISPAGSPINVAVLFSQDNRKGVHPPELCLEGSGEGILSKSTLTLHDVPGQGDVPIRRIKVSSKNHQEVLVLYTYRSSGRYTSSFWTQQLDVFLKGLLGENAKGAMIQISTPVLHDPSQPITPEVWQAAEHRAMVMFRMVIIRLDKILSASEEAE